MSRSLHKKLQHQQNWIIQTELSRQKKNGTQNGTQTQISEVESFSKLTTSTKSSEVKVTKTALETGRSFATLFSDMALRNALLDAGMINLKDYRRINIIGVSL